jgi:protein-disulfide isomerase
MAKSEQQVKLAVPVGEKDHAQGPADAPVTLLEYGDYECPHCLQAYPIVKRLQLELGSSLLTVFRHFPQNNIHPHASVAAQAAEAAGAQGKFWDMHSQLFEHQDELIGDATPTTFALRIPGLEIYQFEADLSSQRFADRVRADYAGGVSSGVKRTPTFFINDVRYDGPISVEAMLTALRAAAG